jgi:UDP-glucose 4-epimerase
MKNNINILITGGCGFVGLNLIEFILDNTKWEIRVLDNLFSGKKEVLSRFNNDRLSFIKGDIRDNTIVKKATENCDYVVNLAAQVGVIESIKDPFFDMDVNINGILTLLESCKQNNVKRFVQASSAAPLGEQEMPLSEKKVPAPLSPYGASKLAGEGYCSAFSESYDLETVVLRFSNVYGPYCNHKNSVIPLFIRQILSDEILTIYGDGNQTRDFVYVQDICRGIYLSLISKLEGNYNIFQLGTGVETSVNTIIHLLKKLFPNKHISTRYVPKRKGEILRNYSDITKAKKILGYNPKISIQDGLVETAKFLS